MHRIIFDEQSDIRVCCSIYITYIELLHNLIYNLICNGHILKKRSALTLLFATLTVRVMVVKSSYFL